MEINKKRYFEFPAKPGAPGPATLRKQLKKFIIVGHEAGGVGKPIIKNASLRRGRTLHQEELCKTTGVQLHIHTLEFFDTKNRCSGTSQLGLHEDNLIILWPSPHQYSLCSIGSSVWL